MVAMVVVDVDYRRQCTYLMLCTVFSPPGELIPTCQNIGVPCKKGFRVQYPRELMKSRSTRLCLAYPTRCTTGMEFQHSIS